MLAVTATGDQPATIFLAAKWNADGSFQTAFEGQSTNTFLCRLDPGASLEVYAGGDISVPLPSPGIGAYFIITLVFNSANSLVFVNGVLLSNGSLGTNGFTALHFGAATTGGGFQMGGEIGYFALQSDVMPTGQRQSMEGYLANRLGLSTYLNRGSVPATNTPSANLIFTGNSLTAGYNGTINDPATAYPTQLSGILGVVKYCGWQNRGLDGQYITQMTAGIGMQVTPLIDETVAINLVLAFETHNMLADFPGDTAQQIYDFSVAYCEAVLAVDPSIKICWGTVFNWLSEQAGDPRFNEINALFDANHGFCSYYVPLHTIPQLQDPTNTTYFLSDMVHLTPAGYLLVAQAFAAVLTAGQKQITLVDFNGQTGANYVTGGSGLYFTIYGNNGPTQPTSIWFNTGTESPPSPPGAIIDVMITPLSSASDIAAAVVAQVPMVSSAWTLAQVNGAGTDTAAQFTMTVNEACTDAVDVNTGAAVSTTQTGQAPS